MSLNTDNGELHKLGLSQAASPTDENSPFTPLVTQPSRSSSKYQTSTNSEELKASQHDKRKVEKTTSVPLGTSRIPSFRLSTPNNHGYTRVSYANEKKGEEKKHERQISRHGHHSKKESSILFARPKSPLKSTPHIGTGIKEGRKVGHFFAKLNDPQEKVARLVPDRPIKAKGSPIRPMRHPKRGGVSPPRLMERPTQHHTFLTDAADVKQIEQGLLQLMEDFQAGNLSAFGKHSKLHQMEEIREQQESLARFHFTIGAEQDLYPPLSDDGLRISEQNMRTLMEKLENLSEAIENLHTDSAFEKKSNGATSTTSQNHEGTRRGSHFSAHQASPLGIPEQNESPSVVPHSTSPPPIPARPQGYSPSLAAQSTLSNPGASSSAAMNLPSSATPLITNIGCLEESSSQPPATLFAPRSSTNTRKESASSTNVKTTKRGSLIPAYNGQDSNVMTVNANTLSKRIADT